MPSFSLNRRHAFAAAIVPLILGCSGFMTGMNEGLETSARQGIVQARTAVEACDPSPSRDTLSGVVDRIEQQLDNGETDGMTTTFNAALVQGALEEGCTETAIEAIRAVNPELVK